MTAGVPEGSILGPVHWNLAYDGVLEMENLPGGVETLAYADDLAVVVTAREERSLERAANEGLARVVEWMEDNHLQLAPAKTEALYLTGRKRTEGIHVVMAGHPIEIRKEAKYLGVILDKGLNGSAHVKYAAGKAQRVAVNLARILPRVGGASELNRRLLASVAESTALYAAPIWADMALRTAQNRGALRSAQRTVAIRVCRAYRTVPTEALLVLAKMLPWDLLAGERSRRFLEDDLELAMARRATIDLWQEEWDQVIPGRVTKGVWTKSLIPDLRKWLNCSHGELSYCTTQVLTGHGQFRSYMVKINKASSETCVLCDSGEPDDIEHTILRCEALREAREPGFLVPSGAQVEAGVPTGTRRAL
ncbi:MAG TPA: reverse transcriptase domain-containing protein, partial [Nitrososphaerales archaeon]|nr:reverse transcriptase domain-containing protein [Nitrososphaerales archaeon]